MLCADREHKTTATEETSLVLTWKDLIFLHCSKITFTSVENAEKALLEEKNGGARDAISLATFAYPEAKCAEIENKLKEIGKLSNTFANCHYLYQHVFLDEAKVDAFCPKDKIELIDRTMRGIAQHIQTAFEKDKNIKPAFLLVSRDNDALIPYRFQENPLGFCGRAFFKSHDVKKAIIAPVGQWDTLTAFRAVIAGIKQARLENAISPEKLSIAHAALKQYREKLTKRHIAPDKSRENLLTQLENELKIAETHEHVVDALIVTARDLRSPNPNGTKKFGFSFFGRHVGKYQKSALYLAIESALAQIDPTIDLDSASKPVEPMAQRKNFF